MTWLVFRPRTATGTPDAHQTTESVSSNTTAESAGTDTDTDTASATKAPKAMGSGKAAKAAKSIKKMFSGAAKTPAPVSIEMADWHAPQDTMSSAVSATSRAGVPLSRAASASSSAPASPAPPSPGSVQSTTAKRSPAPNDGRQARARASLTYSEVFFS